MNRKPIKYFSRFIAENVLLFINKNAQKTFFFYVISWHSVFSNISNGYYEIYRQSWRAWNPVSYNSISSEKQVWLSQWKVDYWFKKPIDEIGKVILHYASEMSDS